MTPELKQQWIEALRSGKYSQGTRFLRRIDDNYCCLGVLCDLVAPDQWIQSDQNPQAFAIDRNVGYLPERLRERVGLGDSMQAHLMRMNDDGQPFADIAAYIEEHLPTSNTSCEGAAEKP